jgi:hypothetical protein
MSVTEILDELPKLKAEERLLLFQRLKELAGNPPRITGAELAEQKINLFSTARAQA